MSESSVYMSYGGDEHSGYDCNSRDTLVALVVLWFLYTYVYLPYKKKCAGVTSNFRSDCYGETHEVHPSCNSYSITSDQNLLPDDKRRY